MLVSNPYFFFIDDSNNLLISDYGEKKIKYKNRISSILIFNLLFELIHEISVSDNPTRFVVDEQKLLLCLLVTTIVFRYFDISYFDFVHYLF